jgi:hypothetical protein
LGSVLGGIENAAPQGSQSVYLYGNVIFANTTLAINVKVQIYAAQEQRGETTLTDSWGLFKTANSYQPGQPIKITIGKQLWVLTLPYAYQIQGGSYDLGTFQLVN